MNTATPRIAATIARASRTVATKQTTSQLRHLATRVQSIRTATPIPQPRFFSVAAVRRDSSKSAPATSATSVAPSKIYSFEEVCSPFTILPLQASYQANIAPADPQPL